MLDILIFRLDETLYILNPGIKFTITLYICLQLSTKTIFHLFDPLIHLPSPLLFKFSDP